MAFAPPAPPMAPMQFAQSGGGLGAQLQALAKAGTPLARAAGQAIAPAAPQPVAPGSAIPGAQGMTAAGGQTGPMPLVSPGSGAPMGPPAPGSTPGMVGMPTGLPAPPAGPDGNPMPSLLAAVRGMAPQQILDVLRGMSAGGQQVMPPGVPGSFALQGAGMMPSTYGG